MPRETCVPIDEREAFMKSEGFVLYTDISEQLLDHLADQPIPVLPSGAQTLYADLLDEENGFYNANVGLFCVMSRFINQIPARENSISAQRLAFYGLGKEEAKRAKPHTVDHGIDDMDFPWHFSSGLASTVVHSFVDEGKISKEQAGQLTLGDWADVIGSKWFRTFTHSLAYTGFGVYRLFGKELHHYERGAFENRLISAQFTYEMEPIRNTKLLNVTEKEDPEEGKIYLTASLDPAYRTVLRAIRKVSHQGESIGCTTARKAAMLPANYADTMPRARRLQELGYLSIGEANEDDIVLARQELTAIDRTLKFFANQLRTYDRLHGTPQLPSGSSFVTHRHLQPTGVLVRPMEEDIA